MKRVLRDLPVAQPRHSLRAVKPAISHKPMVAAGAAAGMPAPLVSTVPPAVPNPTQELSVEQARARAEKTGYDEGYRRGMAQARADLDVELQKLARLSESFAALVEQQPQSVADLAADFAFSVTCRVLGEHLVSPAAVHGCVTQALSQVTASGPIVLRVHPQDVQLLERAGIRQQGLEVRPDPDVVLGGCFVEHAQGGLDARLETQLEELKQAVLSWRAGETA